MYKRFFKRVLDIVLSFTAIVLLSPLFVVLAVLVRIKLGSPVIFRQKRPGKIDPKTGQEKIFTLYKFRSMTEEKDDFGQLLPAEKRLTSFGRKLRSTSFDELPELFNILRGDMSIVGPRPLLVKYLPLYTEEQRRRHLVRPGLTGYAQVNGRNALSWEDKFRLDGVYVDRMSFSLDVSVIFKTVRAVLKREGISGENKEIIGEFRGNATN